MSSFLSAIKLIVISKGEGGWVGGEGRRGEGEEAGEGWEREGGGEGGSEEEGRVGGWRGKEGGGGGRGGGGRGRGRKGERGGEGRRERVAVRRGRRAPTDSEDLWSECLKIRLSDWLYQ